MDSGAGTAAQDFVPAATPSDRSPARNWIACESGGSRAHWHPKLQRVFDYWLTISPPGILPGRQHFDPIRLGTVLPHIWVLDVVHEAGGPRFRYRLAGTKEVETLRREVTGQWFDDVHRLSRAHPIYARFAYMMEHRVPTYRKGTVGLTHEKDHRIVENCMLPLAADGISVDLIVACSIVFYSDGQEV